MKTLKQRSLEMSLNLLTDDEEYVKGLHHGVPENKQFGDSLTRLCVKLVSIVKNAVRWRRCKIQAFSVVCVFSFL